jgi:hypothetical protein
METLYNKILIPKDELTFDNIDVIITFISQEFIDIEHNKTYSQEDIENITTYITNTTAELFEITEKEAESLILLHSFEKSKRRAQLHKSL